MLITPFGCEIYNGTELIFDGGPVKPTPEMLDPYYGVWIDDDLMVGNTHNNATALTILVLLILGV